MSTPEIDPKRLEKFKGGTIVHGSHAKAPNGKAAVCMMEWVAYLAHEKHGDHPDCACPVLAAYGRRLNDASWPSDAGRTEALGPMVVAMINTRSTREVERKRAWFFADRTIRELLPMVMRMSAELVGKLTKYKRAADDAVELEALAVLMEHAPEVNSSDGASATRAIARGARDRALKLRDRAWAERRSAAASYAAAAYADYAAYAAANAEKSKERDRVLSEFAEDVVQVLISMKAPGCEWLDLTEAVAA